MAWVEERNGILMLRWRYLDADGIERRPREAFTGAGGRRAAKAEANRREAQDRERAELEQRKRLAALRLDGSVTLADFVEQRWMPYREARCSAATVRTDRERMARILPEIGDRPLMEISGILIDEMMTAFIRRGWSAQYAKGHFNVLRSCLRQAFQWGLIEGEPYRRASPPRVPRKADRPVARLDESATLAQAFADAGKPVAAAYVLTLALTGARPGELLALMWDSVDFDKGTIRIWRAQERYEGGRVRVKEVPKTEQSVRVIRLPRELIDMLRRLRVWHGEMHLASGGLWAKDGLVFPSVTGTLWKVNDASKSIKRMAAKIQVTPGAYSRRHGMASEMMLGGVPPIRIAERMGNSPETVLRNYSHLLDGDDAALAFLEGRAGKRSG